MIVLGLMSGTSADGTDVAVVEISGRPPTLSWRLLCHLTVPHPPPLRAAILAGMRPETGTVDKLCALNIALGEQFAQAALNGIRAAGLSPSDVAVIGSHGQTVWHDPDGEFAGTLQLGETAVIVERTGIPTIGNFRARDMATGGQGAPLVAYPDVLLLTHSTQTRAAQNIGGIGNVTFLPPHNRPEMAPFAFDTGPGNVLLDNAISLATNGAMTYDRDGAVAAQGQVNLPLLDWLMSLPYLHQKLPKTTGRELFTAAFTEEIWQRGAALNLSPPDIIATLTAYTAQTIAHAYQSFLPASPDEVIVSGGGASNPVLMGFLARDLAPARVMPSDAVGIPVAAKESLAFAILAYESWHGRPGNLSTATGANKQVVLGHLVK